jgi:hypothetical protein
MRRRLPPVAHFILWAVAFLVCVYALSNLLPLLLRAATKGLTLVDDIWVMGFSLAISLSMVILANGVYRLDRRAGRIRNKVKWFE